MRIRYLLGAALALALVPGVAAAEECQACPGGVTGTLDEYGNCICPPSTPPEDVGGTGTQMQGESGEVTEQAPSTPEEGVGGTAAPQQSVTVVTEQPSEKKQESEHNRMGLTVTANGGVEGYTSSLAPRINPGPAWGVTIGAMPTNIVGLELNYAGATNSVDDPAVGDANTRIVRNGGSANVRVNLLPTPLAPFVFAGAGINWATVSNEAAGYRNDTFGSIPMGAGLDWRIGDFTAGARFTFNYLFDREFTPPTQTGAFGFGDKQGGDIYNGLIQVGGVF